MTLYYKLLIDTGRDYTFAGYLNDVSSYVTRLSWQFGALGVYDSVASAAYLELALSNANGEFNLQDSNALYYGKIRRGTLVRVQASQNAISWTNLCTLKISQLIPTYTMNGAHELTVKAIDITQDFFNQEFVAPLQTNVRVDEILDALHTKANAIWPYESYYRFFDHTSWDDGKEWFDGSVWTDFETAETTLPFYGDNLDRGQGVRVQQYIKDAVEAEVFGLYWFSPRSELFNFISRYHASDTAVSWNITIAITDAPQYSYARDLVNDIALSYYPRAQGAANSILWESSNVPFQIAARDTKRITIKYRDPDNESSSVGAIAVNDLVKGTDIVANTQSDGLGLDKTDLLDLTLIKGAASSELIISNRKRGDPSYITTLQLRGTPLTAYNREIAYAYNDDSVFGLGTDESTGNDRASRSVTLYGVSDIEFAQDYCDYMVSVFAEPTLALERLTIPSVGINSDTESKVLSHTIGDVINFVDTANGHDMDYMIVGEKHTVKPNTNPPMHSVTYTLRPTSRGSVFILGESTYDGGDIFSF